MAAKWRGKFPSEVDVSTTHPKAQRLWARPKNKTKKHVKSEFVIHKYDKNTNYANIKNSWNHKPKRPSRAAKWIGV